MTLNAANSTNYEDLTLNLKEQINKYIHVDDIANNPFPIMASESNYYEINDIVPHEHGGSSFDLRVLHLNIQGLSSKYDDLNIMLSQLLDVHVKLDVILLCETFINDHNAELFNIPGYTFIHRNRSTMVRGGVAIYIRDSIRFKLRDDITIFREGEFESLFIDITDKHTSTIVGEI